MKTISFLTLILISPLLVFPQTSATFTIEQCYEMARQNYPMLKQMDLILSSEQYSVDNIKKGYLPQVTINGQATYQSDVTQLPIKIPNMEIPTMSKDQYKIYTEVNQTIYDGGIINRQEELINANSKIEQQKTEVELYKLRERINQLYFGIILINEQLLQIDLLKKDIASGINKIEAAIKNGIALKSSIIL